MMEKNSEKGGFRSRVRHMSSNVFIRKIINIIFPPPPFINVISKRDKIEIRKLIFRKNARVLDIGAGISKGPGSWLWRNIYISDLKILRLDIVAGPGIDFVADATDMPDGIGEFDAVILQSVPEHVLDIKKLFSESIRVLKPGGLIYIEMPFLQGVHGDPNDYWRLTLGGLIELINPCVTIKSGVSGGPVGSIIWIISDLVSNISPWTLLNIILRFISRWALSPLRFIDLLIIKTDAANRLACEHYYLGKKI